MFIGTELFLKYRILRGFIAIVGSTGYDLPMSILLIANRIF